MTKERVMLIFLILVIIVVAVGLSVQISSKNSSTNSEEWIQPSTLNDSVSEETQSSEDAANVLGASEPMQKIEPGQIGEECYVRGCNNQVCTDRTDFETVCEWHDTYACYNNATCERQPDGECGWTRSEEIMQCIRDTVPDIANLI